jgi:hypothetical protein
LYKKIFFALLLFIADRLYPQPATVFKEIQAVDSIALTKSTASFFAKLYSKTMVQIEEQLTEMDTATISQIRKLEINFSNYFLKACNKYKDSGHTDSAWKSYFETSGISPLQLKLLGINAHINGDLWRALRDSYSIYEIQNISKTVFLFHQSLLKIYNDVYHEAIAESWKVKTLDLLSLGLSEKYGKHLLRKWRKRQIKLATLYYFKQNRFEQKRKRTERKKTRIDNLIICRL